MFSTRALKQRTMPGGAGGIDSASPQAYRKCSKFEVSTVQVDPYLQATAPNGGDAFGGNVSMGIQVPDSGESDSRYLILLARAKFNSGRRVRLVGIRQYASIGAVQVNDSSQGSTTIAAASNGQSVPIVAGTINVASTSGFAAGPGDTITVITDSGAQTFTYTATTPTSFTGVSGGTSATLFTGDTVTGSTAGPANQYVSYVEKPIVTPRWRFPDGNISWHVMALQPNVPAPAFLSGLPAGVSGTIGNQTPGFAFANAMTPAILGLSSGASDAPYTPANGGRPYGVPLTGDLGNMHDMRFPWDNAQSWHYSVDVSIPTPCDIALYCSVLQTNISTRKLPKAPADSSVGTAAWFATLTPEDRFMLANPDTSQYWRVAGSLVFAENCDDDEANT